MSKKKDDSQGASPAEKALVPLAALTGSPTNLFAAPFEKRAPEGLVWIYSAANTAEADLLRQLLGDAGFHVEYVPSPAAGVFGASGNVDVYVRLDEEKEAREFLNQLEKPDAEDPSQ